jgi:ergot alkaloid biosynthesis protein
MTTSNNDGRLDRVLITGGTGNTGRYVAARLAELGFPVRTASRAAPASSLAGEHVRFDWADASTHAPALSGVGRVYLVAPSLVDDPARLMLPFIKLALAKGVRRMVLLSSSAIAEDAPGLGTVARALRDLSPEWAVLKPSWFMQNFVDPRHAHRGSLIREGRVVTATGAGRVGFVDADDIAEVAVRALTDEVPHNTAHVITGPEALGYGDVAAILARISGRPMQHVPVDDEAAARALVAAGMPERYAALLVGLDAAIREGVEDRITDTVARVTGRAPRSFEAFARAHAHVFRGA